MLEIREASKNTIDQVNHEVQRITRRLGGFPATPDGILHLAGELETKANRWHPGEHQDVMRYHAYELASNAVGDIVLPPGEIIAPHFNSMRRR